MSSAQDWPKGLTPYKRTAEFTETSVPPALLRSHATKMGVWARLHVLSGQLSFVDDFSGDETVLFVGIHSCIFPERKHHISPIGHVTFFVEFCRPGQDDGEEAVVVSPENLPHRR